MNRASEGRRPYDPHIARHEGSMLPLDRTGHAFVYLCAGWLRSRAATGSVVGPEAISLSLEGLWVNPILFVCPILIILSLATVRALVIYSNSQTTSVLSFAPPNTLPLSISFAAVRAASSSARCPEASLHFCTLVADSPRYCGLLG
jgi:hypothetical protein